MGRIVLVHSPLVGPSSWEPVASLLEEAGEEVRIPSLRATLEVGPPYFSPQVEIVAAALDAGTPATLAGHSGAGPLLLAAGTMAGSASRYLFVDAALPHPGRAWTETVSPELAGTVRRLAGRDGFLPSWATWWGEETMARLLPDRAVRERFVAGCPRLPLAMFEEAHRHGAKARPDTPAAYLRLSEAYDEEAAHCEAMGWPVERHEADHLALLNEPSMVAEAITRLAGRLG